MNVIHFIKCGHGDTILIEGNGHYGLIDSSKYYEIIKKKSKYEKNFKHSNNKKNKESIIINYLVSYFSFHIYFTHIKY